MTNVWVGCLLTELVQRNALLWRNRWKVCEHSGENTQNRKPPMHTLFAKIHYMSTLKAVKLTEAWSSMTGNLSIIRTIISWQQKALRGQQRWNNVKLRVCSQVWCPQPLVFSQTFPTDTDRKSAAHCLCSSHAAAQQKNVPIKTLWAVETTLSGCGFSAVKVTIPTQIECL